MTLFSTPSLIGTKFGRWTATGMEKIDDRNFRYLECICACGVTKFVHRTSLRAGLSTSCGCRRSEVSRGLHITHGETRSGQRSSTYRIWGGVKERCLNKSSHAFPRYGGRGIELCDRWRDYALFLHDMGECPPGRSLERINNDGGYEPSNCRWATSKEQSLNTRRNHLVPVGMYGVFPLSEACEMLGRNYKAVHSRIKRGWTVERALAA